LLSDANVGVVLEPEERDADTIRLSIQRILDDESMRSSAEVLCDHFASMPHPSQIAATIDQLV
jgi:UDP:flavonoid glycosyltransferase YjiC (YdhE family)